MQVMINVPDTLPKERLQILIKEIELALTKEAALTSEANNLAWELGKDLFGKHGSGLGNLSKDRKKIIKEKLYAKHRTD